MRLSQSLGKQVLLLALLVPCDMQVAVIGKDCNRPKVITSRFVLRKSSKIKRVERLQAASAPQGGCKILSNGKEMLVPTRLTKASLSGQR